MVGPPTYVSYKYQWTYSYGHLLVITGYEWDYIFYKWGYKYLKLVKDHNCNIYIEQLKYCFGALAVQVDFQW